MYIKGDTINFKSNEDCYNKEIFGVKNNTVKLLTKSEMELFNLNKPILTKIRITLDKDNFFIRNLSDITLIQIKGYILIIFTWEWYL